MVFVLGVRLAVIALLTPVLSGAAHSELLLLLGGAAVSFFANYTVSRTYLFAHKRPSEDRQEPTHA